ncbi:glycine cleavage system protein H [Streptomyces sp. NPDC056910]|uniref:glycine cleavage system protein H n=1 Tax=Streptomyces sp. NPDC056910 TaxID=3345964 RepID=UPI003674EACC
MSYPEDLRYTKQHEWVSLQGITALVGLTEFAVQRLGDDISFIDLQQAEVGTTFAIGDKLCAVESVMSAIDLHAPMSGVLNKINETVIEHPGEINKNMYEAWIVELQVADPDELKDLLTADQYEAYIKELSAP